MPVSGNYGTPGNPYGDIYSSFWELQWYTGSDPAHVEGDFWGRSDLDSGDKIATIRFDNGSSVVDIPAFPVATDPDTTDIKKVSGIETPSGEAWMPIFEGGGAYSYLGYHHGGTRHSVHDSLSAIPSTGLAHRYDSANESLGTLSTWTDIAGSEDLTGTAPEVVSDGINGNKSVRFDNVDDLLQAQSASAWAFLHDGSPFTAYFVAEVSGSDVFNVLASTMNGGGVGSTYIGISVLRDDSSATDAFRLAISNGSTFIINDSINNEWPADSPRIFVVRHDGSGNYEVWNGKTSIATYSVSGWSADDPNEALRIGYSSDASSPLNGDVGHVPIYSVAHDTSTRETTTDYLADQFGITV